MDDRQLLELAAKVAGLNHFEWGIVEEGRQLAPDSEAYHRDKYGIRWRWNPLQDDGAALRLAVKLSLWLSIGDTRHPLSASEASTEDGESIIESHGGDPYAATRRCIVRAAAQIGRNTAKGDGGGV